ncbi:CDP-diacylglycerol--glycerol-3-phosphate 3-phosphatidyltransferase [Janibacter corallicola]|uniref:CDP-diacylglycerol--glycerol-3-phosphate 3-phosphatidyltransferase n=1 Tax=Janibacter corallicola TaxID=415212 RepID=UPI0008368CAF|nr:CDP-diacylglycerol--glycerol-3-phosphate 3-phosphatidyltransferase [Janibacter corallicola]
MSTEPRPPAAAAELPEPSPWNVPNALTVLRILLVPVFVWLVLRHGGDETASRWWAFLVFAIAIITDRIDGDLARAKGLVTTFGKVADPIADKALTGAGFITLSMIGQIPWWITVVILAREIGITAMRFWVIRHGVMPASRGGKIKTFLQALAIGLFVMPLASLPVELLWRGIAWAILIGALLVTIATAVDYVMKALTLRSTSERARTKQDRREGRG